MTVFQLLKNQTRQKLQGIEHIENRLISLDELDARPIKKGKAFPKCEFGSTLQMGFNQQGFLVTAENFIGQPNDKTLYAGTLAKYKLKMKKNPEGTITDKGYRSKANRDLAKPLQFAFFGKVTDVSEERRKFCISKRSATEGLIGAAKQRGMGESLYRGIEGDKIWTTLGQTAYNLRKFYLLYIDDSIEEETLLKLGIFP